MGISIGGASFWPLTTRLDNPPDHFEILANITLPQRNIGVCFERSGIGVCIHGCSFSIDAGVNCRICSLGEFYEVRAILDNQVVGVYRYSGAIPPTWIDLDHPQNQIQWIHSRDAGNMTLGQMFPNLYTVIPGSTTKPVRIEVQVGWSFRFHYEEIDTGNLVRSICLDGKLPDHPDFDWSSSQGSEPYRHPAGGDDWTGYGTCVRTEYGDLCWGCELSDTVSFVLQVFNPAPPPPPVCAFSYDIPVDAQGNPTIGKPPFTSYFQDKSYSPTPSAPITSWYWEFGDGATSNQQNTYHTYTTSGTFYPKLTVANAGGSSSAIGDKPITLRAVPFNAVVTGIYFPPQVTPGKEFTARISIKNEGMAGTCYIDSVVEGLTKRLAEFSLGEGQEITWEEAHTPEWWVGHTFDQNTMVSVAIKVGEVGGAETSSTGATFAVILEGGGGGGGEEPGEGGVPWDLLLIAGAVGVGLVIATRKQLEHYMKSIAAESKKKPTESKKKPQQ